MSVILNNVVIFVFRFLSWISTSHLISWLPYETSISYYSTSLLCKLLWPVGLASIRCTVIKDDLKHQGRDGPFGHQYGGASLTLLGVSAGR